MPEACFEDPLLDLVAAPVLLLDGNGRILRLNRHCFGALGGSPLEVQGIPFWEVLFPAGERAAAEAAFLSGHRGGLPFLIEGQCPCAHSARIRWSCAPAPDGNVLATGVQVTNELAKPGESQERSCAEQALRQAAEQYRLLFENNPHPMWVFDNETLRFLAVNEAAVQRYGYSRDEFLAMTIRDIRPPETIPDLLADVAAHKRGLENSDRQWQHRKKDGSLIDVEITRTNIEYFGRPARLVLAHDVTASNRAGQAQRESERRYRDLFEKSPVGVYRTTPEGRILLANPALLRMLGYSSFQELAARNLESEGFEPDYPRGEFKRRLEAEGEIRGQEAAWRGRDGSAIFVRENARAVHAADGSVSFYEGLVEDITARKLAEEALRKSEARFRAIFEGAATAILIVQLNGKVLECNPAAETMLGYRGEELRAVHYSELVHSEDRETTVSAARALAGGLQEHMQAEVRLRRRDGQLIWGCAAASLVRGVRGEPQFVIAMIEDVTTRKHAEEKLRKTVEDLARSNAELQDFAYVASHDLQEPLRMVTSFMQLLKSRYRGKLEPEAEEFIGFAVTGAMRMKVLIDDLLSYSRLGARARRFRMTRSHAAFQQALMNLAVALDESGAEVVADDLPVLSADAGQLVQLFQNLIGNAVKFRDTRPPRVKVSAERTGDCWTFSVSDNGIGMEAHHCKRVFEIFYRLHTKDEYPGSGMGLTVCQKIVEHHGGRIWVESVPGEGSTFHFTIPDLPCGE